MYWEEKLAVIKKIYPKPIFRDMFRDGGGVIEKIIRIFHNASFMTFTSCDNPETLLKDRTVLKEVTILEFEEMLLNNLDDKTNYWLLLINIPMGKSYQVYDCQKEPLMTIYNLVSRRQNQSRFYIVDKKYRWLYYIDLKKKEDTVSIYESNNE